MGQPAEIGDGTHIVNDTAKHLTAEGFRSASLHVMPVGTVLLTTRAPIGKVAITGAEMCCNQGFKNLVCSKRAYNEYLCRYLRFRSGALQSLGSGATFKELSKRTVTNIEIALPSLEIQHEAVMKLSKIEEAMVECDRMLTVITSLVKSRFVEMFGRLPRGEYQSLKQVCSIITDGTHQPPKFVAEGIPFLFVSNIVGDSLTYDTQKYITKTDYENLIRRTPVEPGDLLISAVGSFGHPAVVRSNQPFCFQRHIAYLKPKRDIVNSEYLHSALLSPESQAYFDREAKGVAQRTVTLKSFKELKVPVPPIELQNEFADFAARADKSRFGIQREGTSVLDFKAPVVWLGADDVRGGELRSKS